MMFKIFVIFQYIARKAKAFYYNKILCSLNKLQLKINTVHYGNNCKICAKFHLIARENATITIGNDFQVVSSYIHNPLCFRDACFEIGNRAMLHIGNNVGMSSPIIWVRKSLTIGNNVKLGGCVSILDSDAHSLNYLYRRECGKDQENRIDRDILIEDDVLVGANSIILKGVHIGARTVIGANSVVTTDIPNDCIAAGNPAKVIRYLQTSEVESFSKLL